MQVSFTQQHQACKRPASRQSPAAPKAVARQQQLVTPAKCHQQPTVSDQQLAGASVQQPKLLQRQQQPCSSNGISSSSSRRGVLGMLGAAVGTMALVAAPVQPVAAAAAVNSGSALEEYMKLEDAGKLKDQRSLENIRWVAARLYLSTPALVYGSSRCCCQASHMTLPQQKRSTADTQNFVANSKSRTSSPWRT
jgi:hypothetical protein